MPDMRLGLGTGTTAAQFIDLLGAKVAEGLKVTCVATSERTRLQANSLKIPLISFEEVGELDLTIDGADEFDPDLRLIKGGGGALCAKKSSRRPQRAWSSSPIARSSAALGKFPLPIESSRFGSRRRGPPY